MVITYYTLRYCIRFLKYFRTSLYLLIVTLILFDFDHDHVNVDELCAGAGREQLVELVIILHELGERELQQLRAGHQRREREKHLAVQLLEGLFPVDGEAGHELERSALLPFELVRLFPLQQLLAVLDVLDDSAEVGRQDFLHVLGTARAEQLAEGFRFLGVVPGSFHEDSQHQVVIVDQVDQLLLSGGENCSHSQHETFDLFLQFQQQVADQLVRKVFGDSDDGRGEFRVAAGDLKSNRLRFNRNEFNESTHVMRSSFFGEFGRIALLDALDVHTEDLLEARPNDRLEVVPILVQRRNAPFVAHQLIA